MIGWWQCPSGQACDPRWASLSLAGRGMLASLLDAADGARVLAWEGDLYELASAVSGRAMDAATAIDEVRDAGLVVEVDAGLELRVRGTDRPETADAPSDAPAPTPAPRRAAPAGPAGDRRTAAKRLHSRFSKRDLNTAAARLAWLSTDEGRDAVRELGLDDAAARELAEGAGQRRGTFGASHGASHGASRTPATVPAMPAAGTVDGASHGASRVSPSRLSPSERDRRNDNDTAGAHGASHGASLTPASASRDSAPGASAGTADGASGLLLSDKKPEQQLYDLQQATEGGFTLRGGVDQVEAVAAVFASSGLSLDAIASVLRNPAELWPSWEEVVRLGTVNVNQLAGKRGPDGFPCKHAHAVIARARTAAKPDTSSPYPSVEETQQRIEKERAVAEKAKNDPVMRRALELVRSTPGAKASDARRFLEQARAELAGASTTEVRHG